MNAAILIAVMSLVTIALRFLPFLIFRKETPSYITYLGKVLPMAMIALLVVYCLKDTDLTAFPFGFPELFASACVIILQARNRNAILSILSGTAVYMILIRLL